MTQTFIPGKPVPQPRPRAMRLPHNGGIRIYEPAHATAWKATIATHMRALNPVLIESGPVRMDLMFVIKRPKSHLTKKGVRRKGAPITPVGRNVGDVDNLAKAVLDACNGILYRDDSQVIHLGVVKTYSSKPGVQIIWS